MLCALHGLFKANRGTCNPPIVVAIVGGPGAGKTMFSMLFYTFIRRVRGIAAVYFSLDGYHVTNEYLLRSGMRPVKGLPQTMDEGSACDHLREALACNSVVPGKTVSFWMNCGMHSSDVSIFQKHTDSGVFPKIRQTNPRPFASGNPRAPALVSQRPSNRSHSNGGPLSIALAEDTTFV